MMMTTMTDAEYDAALATRQAVLGTHIYGERYGAPANEHMIARVAGPVEFNDALLAVTPREPRNACHGKGYVGYSDDSWPCRGCAGCAGSYGHRVAGAPADCSVSSRTESANLSRAHALAAHAVGVFVWRASVFAAQETLRQSLLGFWALAAVGAQIARVATVGQAVQAFADMVIRDANSVVKGRWYEVVGARGKAKAHKGLIGECVWIGESTYEQARPANWRGAYRGRTSTTLRAGLLPMAATPSAKPVYVPASCLRQVPAPTGGPERREKIERERALVRVRPEFYGRTGAKGDVGLVVAGEHAGKSGVVFWAGDKGKGLRVGVSGPSKNEPRWCSGRDVVGPAKRFVSKFEDEQSPTKRQEMIEGAHAVAEILGSFEADEFRAACEEWAAAATAMEASERSRG